MEENGSVAFRGAYFHSLDVKGRVSMPAPFRSALSEVSTSAVVLTNFVCDGARCLDGFSKPAWEVFETKLRERGRFDPKVRTLENYYLARAVECGIDGSGRINIPHHLREYAGLERDIVFTASLHGFRLWNRRVWELIFQQAEAALLDNPAMFADVDV